ncbi:unnamed protein product, partial [Mesorhabditis spiculigera]
MHNFYAYFLLALLCLTAVVSANDEFFQRSAKWAKLISPSGGSLVSGRGNFRPGFNERSWRSALYEPSFNFRKRSAAPRGYEYMDY